MSTEKLDFTIDPPSEKVRCVRWIGGGVMPADIVHEALWDALQAALATQPQAPQGAVTGWQPIETAPYEKRVLAWLFLPKNPKASALVVAERVYVEADEGDEMGEYRRTVGCWWANGMYYPVGHVTHWMPLPAAPETPEVQK